MDLKKVFIMMVMISIVVNTSCSSKVKEIDDAKYLNLMKETELSKVYVRAEEEVWEEMHQMANTKIKADEIWGEIEITEDRVNALIIEVLSSKYPDKKRLLTILYNWKKQEFSNAVEEHNYLWRKLGGTIGKAYELRIKE